MKDLDKFRDEVDGLQRISNEPTNPPKRLQPVPWNEIGSLKPRDYIVKGWADQSCFSCLYGPSNSGKTFLATDLALHVAMGWDWHGSRVKQGGVIYIAPEGGYGLRERLDAIKHHHNLDDANVPFFLIPEQIDLCHQDTDAKELIEEINSVGKKIGGDMALIIIDTVSRSFQGGDENSSQDMGRFIANCDLIRKGTNTHVMGIHHTGKDQDRGMRGSSLLLAAMDTSIKVKQDKNSGVRTATIDKQRDHAPASPISFTLDPVQIGTDEDGDPITSCIVKPTNQISTTSQKPLTGNNRVAMDALHDALIQSGKQVQNKYGIPNGAQCVDIKDWREEFYARKDGEPGAKQKASSRAKSSLQDIGLVAYRDGLVWNIDRTAWSGTDTDNAGH
jgi:hypothetical protein